MEAFQKEPLWVWESTINRISCVATLPIKYMFTGKQSRTGALHQDVQEHQIPVNFLENMIPISKRYNGQQPLALEVAMLKFLPRPF